MMKRLAKYALDALERHDRKLVIMDRDNLDPYLERYYLAFPDSVHRERQEIPFNTFLHRFMRSDDPVFHNHPWYWYFTVILKGGYWEHTPWGSKWRGPGHMRYQRGDHMIPLYNTAPEVNSNGTLFRSSRDALIAEGVIKNPMLHSDLHWVDVPNPGETWTLFTRGRSHGKDWGFVPDLNTGKWIQHEEYLASVRKDKVNA